MKKDILALMVALAGWLALPSPCSAQNLAPDNLANRIFTVSITAGSAPFSSTGTYQLATAPVGNDFVVLGPAGAGFAFGTYNYSQTGANTGVATFVDAQAGAGVAAQLVFASASAGSLSLTNARTAGFQTATFSVAAYVSWSPPAFFSSGYTNGQFQAYLSGQPGWTYSLEASTNLSSWIPAATLTAPDLTTLFTDTNVAGAGARFYRVKVAGTAFAPASLAGQTLNVTIDSGAAPLATNGIYQWMAADSNETYQVLGGPGTTDGAGAYSYLKSGANSGLISWTDAQSGISVSQQLFFNSPDSGFYYSTNATGFQAGRFTLAEGAVEFPGNVKFTPDTARAGSLLFPADGTPASLSVTDAAGWVWTLDFPADALTESQAVTMTPFASVDSSQAVLPITNGVVLEPDGLQFCDGVTLTVTPPGPLGPYATLLMGGADGTDLDFVETDNQSGGLSTTLLHFTSAGATDPTAARWAAYVKKQLPKAEAAYAKATNAVTALISFGIRVMPPPPDYPWSCAVTNPAAGQQIDGYIRTVFALENKAVKKLVSAATDLTRLEASLGTNLTDVLKLGKTTTNLVKTLIETDELAAVDNLLVRYYYYTNNATDLESALNPNADSEKFMALYKLAANVTAADKKYGGKGDTNWPTIFKNWSKGIRDGCVKQVHDDHVYWMAQAALNVENFRNTVMNVPPDTTGKFQQKLYNALTFQLSVDLNLTVSGNGSASIEAQGDITVAGGNLTLQGSGTINYLFGTAVSSDGSGTLVPGQSFAESEVVNLNPCPASSGPTAIISLSAFGAGTETWRVPNGNEGGIPGLLQNGCITALLVNGYISVFTSPWALTVPLQNGQSEAVNTTIDAPIAGVSDVKLQFILNHTPK